MDASRVEDPTESRRRRELLAAAYGYALDHGLSDLSLRPLAAAITTSPRVLLYLFGSKDRLLREILAQARKRQLVLVARAAEESDPADQERYGQVVRQLWHWLTESSQQPAIRLFFEAYALSLRPEPGPWAGFAEQSVRDWTEILVAAQPGVARRLAVIRATHTLALLRGLLLHLIAGGDPDDLAEALQISLGEQ